MELSNAASSSLGPTISHHEAPWSNPSTTEIEQPPLPPTDTGKSAWLVLGGSSLIQAPVWETGSVAVIGTTVTGIMYLISPFIFFILTRWPRLRRWFGPIGLFLAATGFLLSSFSTTLWQLILTQGVISAIGCGLLFTPTNLYLDEWFVRRKGLAYGIMWAGKSMTGVGLPFAAEASLRKFGPANTLRAWSVLTILLSAPLLYFLRPRIPLSSTSTTRRIDTSFIHLPSFWMLQAGNVL
ncbi:hypothetical protein CC80DRAFT_597816 [Byssothecium circinans]|uniref:MFS general substrate transporter n=1 Tax=Byssothecium circinans TaxID=147558 RepID=A0A6A5TPT5_9PLEO|nr:hypothetical protein CC80DRAFT_597816 [Byssothecium circinans]